MKVHSTFFDGVKDVLGDKDKMVAVILHNSERIETILEERTIKWQLKELIDETNLTEKTSVLVPDHLLSSFDNDLIEDGNICIQALVAKEQSLDYKESEMTELIKGRIQCLLEMVDAEKVVPGMPLMEQYEGALAVNKKGYAIHYKRDVDELMVNTYNPE